MNQELLSLNETEIWKARFSELPQNQQDIYYTPEYYKLYQEYGDGKAFCFVFKKGPDLAIYPFLKNPVDSKAFMLDKQYFDIQGVYGYNGAISSNYETEFINDFYDHFNSYCVDENIIAEFTRFHPIINNHEFSKVLGDFFIGKKIINKTEYNQICEVWEKQFPDLKYKYKNFLLKYKEVN